MSITIRKGIGTPTTNTAGFIGEIYEDTNTGNRYECTGMYKTTGAKAYGPDYDYIWEKIDVIPEKFLPEGIGGGSGGAGGNSLFTELESDDTSFFKLGDKRFDCRYDMMADRYIMEDDVFEEFCGVLAGTFVYYLGEGPYGLNVGIMLLNIVVENNFGAEGCIGGIRISSNDFGYSIYSATGMTTG